MSDPQSRPEIDIIKVSMRCAALALLIVTAMPASAADRWLRLSTPNFELYTSAGEKSGREIILYFEQVRDFFIKAAPVRFPAEFPVRVVVFEDREQFRQYGTNSLQIAYYAPSPNRDYIVMSDASAESYAVAVHEYMHLIVRRSGLRIPAWLNEGLADVYSTLRPVRDGVAVGDLIPGRMQPLVSGNWLPFDTLASLNTHSAAYNEGERVGVFYGESWALAHMLFLSPAYRDQFGKFLMALNSGKTSAEACEAAYGRSSDQVFADLQKYIAGNRFSGRIFVTRLDKSRADPKSSYLSEFDSRLMLADLLLDTGRLDRARTEYQQLESLQPNRMEITQSLGYLSLAAHDSLKAREYLEKAFAAGDSDPRMCLTLAILEREADQPPASILPPLERAIRSRPGYADAVTQLGLMQIKMQEFEAAIRTLTSIERVTPQQAVSVFSALAYAYLQTGDLDSAARNADTAQKWLQDGGQMTGLGDIRSLIEARKKLPVPPRPGEKLQRLEGILQNIDCTTSPHRLVLLSPSGSLSLNLPDPAAVEFSHKGGDTVQLSCGVQSPHRVVLFCGRDAFIRRFEY